MNQQHKNLYGLLVEIDTICKEHSIEYCLAGGSALGALRNQCFLPWDDDIDLYITRNNWEKLTNLIENDPKIIPEGRNFVYVENAPYHRNPIARYVKTDTTAIYPAQAFSGMTCGQQVELFILDPMPRETQCKNEFIEKSRVYFDLLSPYFVANKDLSIEDFAKHYKNYNKYYWKCKFFGYENVIAHLEKEIRSFSEKDCDEFCLRWGPRLIRHNAEFYNGKRTEILEDREFPVAYKLEHALRIDYGDNWMYIPEGDAQIVHNPIIEDLERPFKAYTDVYIPYIDRERIVKSYTRNKHSNMKLYVKKRLIEKKECRIRMLLIEDEYSKIRLGSNPDVYRMLKERNYEALNSLFSDYYKAQLAKFPKKYGVAADIGDDYIFVAIMNYIQQGKYFSANNILNIRRNIGRSLTEELEDCGRLIAIFRKLSIAVYDNQDVNEVMSIVSEECNSFGDYIDVYRAKLWALEKVAKEKKEWEEIKKIGVEALKLYPFDGEIMAFIAKAQLMMGEVSEAKALYVKATHNTRNGLVWRKAKEDIGYDRMLEEEEFA